MAKAPNERGLRDKIIDSAIEIIAESGLNAITHRIVAAHAGASLGSTTYHFKTLDDLIVAALDRAADNYERYLESWLALHRHEPVERLLEEVARSVYEQSTGAQRSQAIASQELHAAALRRPALVAAAKRSSAMTQVILRELFGREAALVMTPMLAGITTQLIMDEGSYSQEAIQQLLRLTLP